MKKRSLFKVIPISVDSPTIFSNKIQLKKKINSLLLLLLWANILAAQLITFSCPAGFETPVRFSYNGGNTSDGTEQNFIVPENVTEVTIIALGAQGGHVENFGGTFDQLGGAGGLLGGTFPVVAGDNLRIFVAAQGRETLNDGFSPLHGAGGGGGSFVLKNNLTIADLLVAAGGGSGSSLNNDGNDSQAFVTTGTGNGGTTGGANMGTAGAGGGLLTDGADNPDGAGEGEGGKSVTNGATGGSDRRRGGFGGGGGGGESEAAIAGGSGGGGGFIGGNGGSNGLPGQGGVSYLPAGITPIVNNATENTIGNGEVLICYKINPPIGSTIPTLSQWSLLIFGLLILNIGIFFVLRKKQIINKEL